ncbi:DNA/RNA polymerase [Epithele typhae]|uniref:DNA/RNA polymerase n=1 Tax=Epithele typhae TaxID=378194 RepID=UPI0020085513|nr:DNA/RNA polymerase [Epithele typhae]KAH9942472.1 DNA/RNA polymerase [Epithele typhae]
MNKPPSSTPNTDSLVRRLAGASVNKAGQDQTEINRIIAEVSKGSKFYENEKRKDKELTERIERILKLRDEVVKGVDLAKVEESVDKIIAQLEARRDLSQYVVHVDMDAFYASVELLDKPELASKPFCVGGGVLCTASYEARKYGVRSGMASFVAKKLCPDLILLPMHFDRYSALSKQCMDIFRRYDPNLAVIGCDEGYLNITQYCEERSISPEDCVKEMRRVVCEETKLTASAGIAPNRNKPDGQFMLEFQSAVIKSFMRDMPIRKLPGVGRVNERLLDSIGIKTCGDIFTQRAVLSLMDKQFGLHYLLQTYLGIASNVVEPWQREERKSIGAERTFHPISDITKIYAKLQDVAAELAKDMTEDGWTGKTVTLKYKLDTYQVYTRAKSLTTWVSRKQEDLFAIGKELLKPELPLTLRLIGLRVTKLRDLNAEEESKARGIKRFFNSAPTDSPSPKKKRRLAHTEEHQCCEEVPQLSQDGFVTSMPNYVDDTEADLAAEEEEEAEDAHEYDSRRAGRHKPASSSTLSISIDNREIPPRSSGSGPSTKPSSGTASKPASTSAGERTTGTLKPHQDSHAGEDLPLLECPLCGKLLETDNQGLNEHIDFCLSRQAIKEAQTASLKASSSKPISSGPKKSRNKPASASGRGKNGDGLLRFQSGP